MGPRLIFAGKFGQGRTPVDLSGILDACADWESQPRSKFV